MASATSAGFRLGIDFGTSHTTAILRWPDGHARPMLFDGSPLLPSAVYAETDGTLLVGRDAVHAARLDPARFEPNPKRRIDRDTVTLGDQEVPVTAEEETRAADMPLRAGQISLHHGALIHGSNPNQSTRRRCGLTLRYVPPTVQQTAGNSYGRRYEAILVRGEDRYQHFEPRQGMTR